MPFELFAANYSPVSEGNLLSWVDFQDLATYTVVSTDITALSDKVAGVTWTSTDGTCPYDATGINGHPCAKPAVIGDRFNTTNAALVAAMDTTAAAKPYTWFSVVLATSLDVLEYIMGWANSTTNTDDMRGFGQGTASTGRWAQHIVNGATAVVSSTAATDIATAHVLCWHGNVTHNFQLDNAAAAPAAAVQSVVGITPDRVALFGRPRLTPDNPATSRIGENLFYGAELDAAAVTRVANYLKTKWGTP